MAPTIKYMIGNSNVAHLFCNGQSIKLLRDYPEDTAQEIAENHEFEEVIFPVSIIMDFGNDVVQCMVDMELQPKFTATEIK